MKMYYVATLKTGRVVLTQNPEQDGSILQDISAASWLDAREKVKEKGLWHNPGYGWFER